MGRSRLYNPRIEGFLKIVHRSSMKENGGDYRGGNKGGYRGGLLMREEGGFHTIWRSVEKTPLPRLQSNIYTIGYNLNPKI